MIFHGQPSQDLRYTPLASTPKEVHGEDFTGEPVRLVEEKEVRSAVGQQA